MVIYYIVNPLRPKTHL